ncbi:hypothetical protein E2986_02948 [Frieseomelitta varia]|uniref:Uncharacterized protein n=1 Tax=Frieseomelitta varia TaxID=561572 RepID=A0A833VV70_9HYME|nr:hypothetical protein E2986_02948 [Frieseomelitta varia]
MSLSFRSSSEYLIERLELNRAVLLAGQSESKPRVFSPRMDYDEWTPLGRGDPLKNNPTFDYVPPVLDRVQYWLDSHTTEPSAKRDILVLGVTAKKTSPKIPEQFLKFVDGPKFTRSNHQDVPYRSDFTGSTGAEPPKLVRTSNFRNGPIDYRNQNRIQSIPASYYPSPFYNQKAKPYTMMLPPPLTQKDKIVSFVESTNQQQYNTQTEDGLVLQDPQVYGSLSPPKGYNQQQPGKHQSQTLSKFSPSKSPVQTVSTQVETIKSVHAPQPTKMKHDSATTPSVSFEKSNLIYQSTQTLSGGWPAGGSLATSTVISDAGGQSTRQTTDHSRDQYDVDHHVAAASSNHQVVVEQNANIIVDGDSNENEEVVVGQKEKHIDSSTVSPVTTTMTTTTTFDSIHEDKNDDADDESATSRSSEKMHIVIANSPHSLDIEATSEAKRGPVAVVMPSNYSATNKKLTHTSPSSVTKSETIAAATSLAENSTSDVSSKVEFQPVRGSPIFAESSQSTVVLPNKMISAHQQHAMHYHSTIAPFSSQHPVDSFLGFGPPQAPLSSMMHPSQARPNHGTMHLIGSMRPTVGFRAPVSMPMFPPMTHMHAPPPPVRSTIDHMGPSIVDQPAAAAARPSSPQLQNFPPMFVDSQTSTLIGTEDRYFDRHRSRLPDTTASIFTIPTSSPFLPTVSSPLLENSSLVDTHAPGKEAPVNDGEEREKVEMEMEMEEEEQREKERDSRKKISSADSTTPRVTTVPSLTTDPIFSHYKQPAKPIRGPMYLIIQGHSKVKTYKPTISKHGVPVEGNEIPESVTERQLSKFEQFVQENTRSNGNRAAASAAEKKKIEEKARIEKLAKVRQSNLMSLVESGLASFTVSPSSSVTEDERRGDSVTTIEINAN